ncbi:hypothetical protein FisN_1Hh248 [Fistulifera solaris]|uniref:Methyltransferase type 11 domain-containing protein n=1 Tax=Fistulifera solaris TaxID=1519565 RepID=A0A1Z5JEE4_FISSO|nr:hypothetical protein FisN_1Hh248 [Fistulifera solaris]|eukprot:GAX12316.1 hypothetical protein FisN_1Hh248 [Fistulifera solaris]
MKLFTAVSVLSTLLLPSSTAWTTTMPSAASPRRTTALSAVPPPMIIGPMIKKMREEQEKKKLPMADLDEKAKEAPGLRVGANIWKWPVIWPYDESIFKSAGEATAMEQQKAVSSLTTMLSGMPQVPKEEDLEKAKEMAFDPLQYWSQTDEPSSVMDEDGIAKLQAHFAFYMRDGMSVLELGAGANSYFPSDLKLSRHVGVGANEADMKRNPSLTDTLVVDLNKVVKERDVDSDDLRLLAKEPFDMIVMTCTVDYLTNPREVFRSAWYLIKPGGSMIVTFVGKDGVKDKFTEARTRIWQQYNDDQHMWMTGSFFHFSAGDGWENLRGFDISPENAAEMNAGPLQKLLKPNKANNVYVVQATKGFQDDCIDFENLERSLQSLLWMLPVMEDRDKKLVVPRLTRALETADDKETLKASIERNIEHLPAIYEVLAKMDKFSFTFSMQSQLAADLICDPAFNGNDQQMLALREGLGLRMPQEDFWKPVGMDTSAIEIEDKISLLSYIVPRFGSNDPAQDEALKAFVTGLKPTYAILRSKCPSWKEFEVQLVGAELLATEILTPGGSSREEYAKWLDCLTAADLQEMLDARKGLRKAALEDMTEFQAAREKERQRIAELRQKMEDQVATARRERSMVFNPRTEKMEIFVNPESEKKN